jgi:nucleoid DNA-binding protein
MAKLRRIDLAQQLGDLGFTYRQSRKAVSAVFDALVRAIAEGEVVEIGGLRLYRRKSRQPLFRIVRDGSVLIDRKKGVRVVRRRVVWEVASRAMLCFIRSQNNVEEIRIYRSSRILRDAS